MPRFISSFAFSVLIFASSALAAPKNLIIILTDDQGYEDLSCFGSTRINTPNIDQLAKEGMRLTSFYVASSVCSPSRAGLLTGRMPKRAGVPTVLFPYSETGLPPEEVTLAEMLKSKGYATGMVGKWHLGHLNKYLPTNQGFDYYYGLPYSNDMSIAKEIPLANDLRLKNGYTMEQVEADIAQYQTDYRSMKNIMPLMRGEEIVEYPIDQSELTQMYTKEAVRFIEENKGGPFFLYMPHSMPHHPRAPSKAFKGHSGNGSYADVIEEIDWSVGQVVQSLKDAGLEQDTMIIYCSDNGPAGRAGDNAPSAGELRGRKFDTFEGGQRVPAVIWSPGEIDANSVCEEIVSTLDLFPTFAHYVGADIPSDRIYDGYNVADLLAGKSKRSPRNEIYYYSANSNEIDGARIGNWKYLISGDRLRTKAPSEKVLVVRSSDDAKPMLFNLDKDVAEKENVIESNPEKAAELIRRMKAFDSTIN